MSSPEATSAVTTSTEYPSETPLQDLSAPILESARAFDRRLTIVASFSTYEDLSFVNPRQGVNLIQMLGGMTDPALQIEDMSDAANVKGSVSAAFEEACGAAVTSQATGSYYLLGNPTPVTDASW